ncbi:hypothetical protein TNCV_82331 [Trichonephila clavipes]|nr:hypothetical protein TNCV_82331 [Trichonephila clavipes]
MIDDLPYQEVIDSHSSMPIELPNKVLSRVLSAYQKFVEETRQEPTLLENQNTKQDDDDDDDIDNNRSSDNDDDYEDASVLCDTFTE